MSMVNVAKNIRQYSSEELRDLGYRGLLECNGFDLSDFVERIFSDYKDESKIQTDQEEVEAIKDEAYDRGWSDAKSAAISAVKDI